MKRRKLIKVFLFIFLLILVSLSIVKHSYKTSPKIVNDGKKVATTTTTIPKPSPKNIATSTKLALSITPEIIKQGEPSLITVEGLNSTSSVKLFTFNNRPLVFFLYEDKVTALLGVDLRSATGTFPILLSLKDGRQVKENFVIGERTIIKAPFDIPDKLGGNTPESEKELISTLAKETKIINALATDKERLWTEKFGPPLKDPLGLYMVKSIVKTIGGDIDFISEENKGSEFTITF